MKFSILLIAGVSATTIRQLASEGKDKDRIPPTPEPFLIPECMKTDQDTNHAICNGTNVDKCRDVDPYLKRDPVVPKRPDPHYVGGNDNVDKGLLRW